MRNSRPFVCILDKLSASVNSALMLYKYYKKSHYATMKSSLIIHGHFYQPPREDPWTGLIPLQESAAPFHDWNRRITKECYGANAASRVLDPQGRISDIVNNYSYLSFNIGPTLLDWLERHAHNVHQKILEADALSMKKFGGHGNAVAQSYNHSILPLDTPEDRKTQIFWGLENFKHHFGRQSEGMWLPETAVSGEVIDLLIEAGLAYIILSPWQAESFSPAGSKNWKPLNGSPIASNRAYRIERRKGSLAVFFYNNFLAQGISFDHYLHNAENLYRTLLTYHKTNAKGNLIAVATDGEIYGHHEPFGDMCIAALTSLVRNSKDLEFSNFGHYLEKHPPREIVKLKEGEGQLGTSWSCFHGVSRWYKNCGCSTGGMEGWSQEWRTPVRRGLRALRDVCMEAYSREMKTLCAAEDPLEIRNRYIEVLNAEKKPRDFAASFLPPDADSAAVTRFLSLLEGQKFAMYMFTSCGWFFAELSGLEPMQNMRYALKTLEYYQPFCREPLLELLLGEFNRAKSNISEMGTGRNIFQRLIMPDRKDLSYPAAVFSISSCLGNGLKNQSHGFYRQKSLDIAEKESGQPPFRCKGTLEVEDSTILMAGSFSFGLEEKEEGLDLLLTDLVTGRSFSVDIDELPETIIQTCVNTFAETARKHAASYGVEIFAELNKVLGFTKKLNAEPDKLILKASELAVNTLLRHLLSTPGSLLEPEHMEKLDNLLTIVSLFNLDIDRESIQRSMTHCLTLLMDIIAKDACSDKAADLVRLLTIVRSGGIEPDLTISQNILFPLLDGHAEEYGKSLEEGNPETLKKIRYLIKLGDAMGIAVEDLKQVLLK
ncbi:MAG: DUF3536 domain-containing protein [Spirochaetales bacterium]|nr:MAG: DUF3536 domain-containing protein [Spirochaetales bacterium]